jgi:hypothetical protein
MSRPSVSAAASSTLSAPTRPATTHRSLGRTLSTAEFWALMARWRVPDAMALDLIEFPGKIGASGKRPRFRFVTRQQRITSFLVELNSALAAAGHDPTWLHRKNRAPPFNGRTPLSLMLSGRSGLGDVLRFLQGVVLQRSLRGDWVEAQ